VLLRSVGGRLARQVDVGQVERHDLLASPLRPRLEDRRRGHLAIPLVEVQAEIEDQVALEEAIALREAAAAQQRVLHDAHHGFVGLRRDDTARHEHDLSRLCARLHGLRHVQVHLVPVEVRVVGRGDGEVKAEGGEGHDLDAVRHDRHFMQRGLPVEEDHVAVLQVALHLVAHLQVLVGLLDRVLEVESHPVVPDDEERAGQVGRSVGDELLHALDVERRNDLRVGQRGRDGARHAHLLDREVGVGCDDGARREVDALPHQVAAHAPVLPLQPLGNRLERPPRLGGSLPRDQRRVVGDQRRVVVLQ